MIPASAITDVSCGQDVHRRVGTAIAVGVFSLAIGALTALSKSKMHYVGLTWADGEHKGGFAVQGDKKITGVFWLHWRASPARKLSIQMR